MNQQVYNVLDEYNLKVEKADKESFKEGQIAISNLSFIMEEVESKSEGNKERFKRELNKLIP